MRKEIPVKSSSLILLAILLACLALSRVHAQNADWSALDADTRALLAPFADNWPRLDAGSRSQLLAHAKRWQAMDADARAALARRNAQWLALPPTERSRLRARYAAWQTLPTDEQDQVRAAAAKFSALPAAQQAALRAQFSALDPDRQRAWMLGPSTGAWIAQAQTLFAYVPADQRDATLDMLRALSADERARLFALARMLPDARREQLRQQLVRATPAQRTALLSAKP